MPIHGLPEVPESVAEAFDGAVADTDPYEWGAKLGGILSELDDAVLALGRDVTYGDVGTALNNKYRYAEGLERQVRDFCAGVAFAHAGVHIRAAKLLDRVRSAEDKDLSADPRWPIVRTWAAIELGFVHYRLGDVERAQVILSEAINQTIAMANPHLEARGHHYLGLVYERLRDHQEARNHLQQALELFRNVGSEPGEARVYDSLGLMEMEWGDPDQAEKRFERSLMLKENIGDRFGTAITLGQLGRLHASTGDYDHALIFLERDLNLSREFGDINARMTVLNNLGDVHLARGQPERALDCYRESLELAEQTEFARGIGFAKLSQTKAYVALGRIEEANRAADDAEAVFAKTGDRAASAALLTQRALIESRRQNYGLAAQHHEEAIAIFRELKMHGPLANALFECGLMFRDIGDIERAAPYLQDAIAAAEDVQAHKLAARYREAVDSVDGRQWIEAVMELRRARERLEEEHRQLQRKDAQVEWLTQMLVHDLQNPLGSIIADLAAAGASADNPPAYAEAVESAHNSARVLSAMLADTMSVLRSSSIELRPRLEDVRLQEVIAIAVDQLRGSARQAGAQLLADVPEALPPISADRGLVRRVLVNLIHNAIKHAPNGEVHVAAVAERGSVVVSVADTGHGIPPDMLDKVFDMWWRAEVAVRGRRVGGSGLGLNFCKAAVEAHGGRIWVKSEVAQGTTFFFRLPIKPPPG